MTRRCILFLGTSSSVPRPDRYTQSIAVCGLRDCILLDVGEGTQIRMASAGMDHRSIKILAITHVHGDHIHGLLPFLESLDMKLSTQKEAVEGHTLLIVAPTALCKYINLALEIIRFGSTFDHVNLSCIEARSLHTSNSFVYTPSKEIRITPIPVHHGLDEAYGYYVGINVGRKEVGVYYSGDGVCSDVCRDRLKQLRPSIVIHEATFLDYQKDYAKALESFHATVYDAAVLAAEVEALALILTHVSSRYGGGDLRDFISRVRRVFSGSVFVAEDLSKISLGLFD